jgi:hypothetical protein
MTRREAYAKWRQINRTRTLYYRKYLKLWNSYYLEQGNLMVTNLKDSKPDPTQGTFLTDDIEKLFIEMYTDVGISFARNTLVEVEVTQKAQDEPNVNGITWEQIMANYATTEGGASIVSISETGRAHAVRLINGLNAQAIEQGWGIDRLADEIEKAVFDEWKITSKFSAERIARTEIIAASNKGAMMGAETSTIPLKKIWLHSGMSGEPRIEHMALNGEERLMNQRFSNGLTEPGMKGAPAEEVINCRCGVAFRDLNRYPLKN